MRLLLDTHVLLWVLSGSSRLSGEAKTLIQDAEAVFVSAASVWEVAIKVRLGKLDVDVPALNAAIVASGFQELPVTARHAAGVATLPPHHNDPFDRLLVAQALFEPLRLLTADVQLVPYTDLVTLV